MRPVNPHYSYCFLLQSTQPDRYEPKVNLKLPARAEVDEQTS
ncbi:hypothetical protein LX90_009314 [Lentzea flava]|nr:hypothetical protein [Lentzea flava]